LEQRKRAQGIPVAIVEDLVALSVFAEDDPKTDFEQFFDAVRVINLRPVTEARTVVRSIICFFMNTFYARMVRGGEALTSRAAGRETRALRRLVLVDEADDFIGLGLNSLKLVMQQGRSFGCGVILSTQLLDHFEQGDDPLKALVGTWILHQMPDLAGSQPHGATCEAVSQAHGASPFAA
jgi:DNA phosphorothioation-dependent restriction protein DptH